MNEPGNGAGKSGQTPGGSCRDALALKGRVELFVTKGAPALLLGDVVTTRPGLCPITRGTQVDFSQTKVLEKLDIMNILVNQGKDAVINALVTGSLNSILRMAVGDRGAMPNDSTVPKTTSATQTALYNEIYRADLDAVSVNVGTPNTHEAQFIKTFNAVDIPIASFSNQASPVVNEVGLITANPSATPLFPRQPVPAPQTPPSDEKLFSIRTFKSVPFQAADDISVTIRYTIFIR